MTAADYFATAHERERPIFEAVHNHLETLGPLYVEYLAVGIFFKNPKRVAALRTMTKWVALGFSLPTKLSSSKLSRKVVEHGSLYHHVINVADATQIDEEVLDWLTQAYEVHNE
jgi:hypothetical protein